MSGTPVIRFATRDDLPAIVGLLADDEIGSYREDSGESLNAKYTTAFDAIAAEDGNQLVVMERDDVCIGCLQITVFQGFDRLGARRAWIEGVRVASHLRGQGLGHALLDWTIAYARQQGCAFVQLAVNKDRTDAIRYYRSLGFKADHEGMKLDL